MVRRVVVVDEEVSNVSAGIRSASEGMTFLTPLSVPCTLFIPPDTSLTPSPPTTTSHRDQIVFCNRLAMYHQSSDSGECQYRSRA